MILIDTSHVSSQPSLTTSRISSYINNVHPIAHQSLYTNLEAFIDSTLPLFNHSLMELKAPGYQNQRFHVLILGRDPEIVKHPGPFRPPEQRATRQWLDHSSRFHDWLSVDLKREFWNIGLQMVLHVKHIKLNSSHHRYEAEDWHVQGQMVISISTRLFSPLLPHLHSYPQVGADADNQQIRMSVSARPHSSASAPTTSPSPPSPSVVASTPKKPWSPKTKSPLHLTPKKSTAPKMAIPLSNILATSPFPMVGLSRILTSSK